MKHDTDNINFLVGEYTLEELEIALRIKKENQLKDSYEIIKREMAKVLEIQKGHIYFENENIYVYATGVVFDEKTNTMYLTGHND